MVLCVQQRYAIDGYFSTALKALSEGNDVTFPSRSEDPTAVSRFHYLYFLWLTLTIEVSEA